MVLLCLRKELDNATPSLTKFHNLSGSTENEDVTNKNREYSRLPNDWHRKYQ